MTSDRNIAAAAVAWTPVSAPVLPEDLVLVSVRGRTFYARVVGVEHLGRFAIAPLDPAVRTRSARLADLRNHWVQQGDPRPAAIDATQASFDHLLDR